MSASGECACETCGLGIMGTKGVGDSKACTVDSGEPLAEG